MTLINTHELHKWIHVKDGPKKKLTDKKINLRRKKRYKK